MEGGNHPARHVECLAELVRRTADRLVEKVPSSKEEPFFEPLGFIRCGFSLALLFKTF
jgi:hypothetical protein